MALAACVDGVSPEPAAPATELTRLEAALAELEAQAGGRLGAFVLDTGNGQSFGWRQSERFGMCSTFKLSLAAFLLRESDAGHIDLNEVIPYTEADLMFVSPVTKENVARGGMTIVALAEATQITSDNAAANLLLKRIGGPEKITAFWRELGDVDSRLDRYEPELNLVPPGEQRDTITPAGIARSVAAFVVGDALKAESRALLRKWMADTKTGLRRIRAALPPGWEAGDKTGTGNFRGQGNKYNDLAVLYPPANRAPLVVIACYEAREYFDGMKLEDETVLRRVGELAVQWVS
jgi:beta-lactamase class A